MEENKGLNVTPVKAAATDPAALPGFVAPRPEEGEGEEIEETAEDGLEADNEDEDEEAETEVEAESDKNADEDDEADDEADRGEDEDGGPVFEAADRRGSITVDRSGVRFRLDDTEAEFTWSEIGAVEYKKPRFGRRFTVVVHDSRGICPAEVEAADKATLKEWEDQLEKALDAHFEE